MNELEARANVAKCDEDLRIATKHREEAAARTMSPANKQAYERALEWEQTCRSARTVAGCQLRNVIGSESAPDLGVVTDAAEIKQRETRQLAAELAILEEYDATRRHSGHDYGSGQRHAELSRRRRELDSRDPLHEIEPPTKEELSVAFERVGRPKLRRAESETYRKGTPATQRTLRAWAMVERWATGARAACACGSRHETPFVADETGPESRTAPVVPGLVEPPRSAEDVGVPRTTEAAIALFAWRVVKLNPTMGFRKTTYVTAGDFVSAAKLADVKLSKKGYAPSDFETIELMRGTPVATGSALVLTDAELRERVR